jgi:hypothetical protein
MSRFGDLLGGKKAAPAPAPEPVVEPVVEEPVVVAESPIVDEDTTNYEEVIEEEVYESDVSLHDMSKKELEDYGRTVGIELDRRHSRKRLVQELEEYLADS